MPDVRTAGAGHSAKSSTVATLISGDPSRSFVAHHRCDMKGSSCTVHFRIPLRFASLEALVSSLDVERNDRTTQFAEQSPRRR